MRIAVIWFVGLYLMAHTLANIDENPPTNEYGGQNVVHREGMSRIVYVYDENGRWMCNYWSPYTEFRQPNTYDCGEFENANES